MTQTTNLLSVIDADGEIEQRELDEKFVRQCLHENERGDRVLYAILKKMTPDTGSLSNIAAREIVFKPSHNVFLHSGGGKVVG